MEISKNAILAEMVESDINSGAEQGEVPIQYLLIEMAGTPYLQRQDAHSMVEDALRICSIDNPRPRVARFLDGEVHNTYTQPSYIKYVVPSVVNNIHSIIKSRTPDGQLRYYEGFLLNAQAYLEQYKDGEDKQQLREYISSMITKTPWEFPDPDPNQPQVELISGGIFDTLTLVEVFRRNADIDQEIASQYTKQLLSAAPKEDIVIVTLLSPEVIEDTRFKLPSELNPFNTTSQKKDNTIINFSMKVPSQ